MPARQTIKVPLRMYKCTSVVRIYLSGSPHIEMKRNFKENILSKPTEIAFSGNPSKSLRHSMVQKNRSKLENYKYLYWYCSMLQYGTNFTEHGIEHCTCFWVTPCRPGRHSTTKSINFVFNRRLQQLAKIIEMLHLHIKDNGMDSGPTRPIF